MALYETFLECGVKTWETVVKALEESENDSIAEQVKKQLVKDYLDQLETIHIMLFLHTNRVVFHAHIIIQMISFPKGLSLLYISIAR